MSFTVLCLTTASEQQRTGRIWTYDKYVTLIDYQNKFSDSQVILEQFYFSFCHREFWFLPQMDMHTKRVHTQHVKSMQPNTLLLSVSLGTLLDDLRHVGIC